MPPNRTNCSFIQTEKRNTYQITTTRIIFQIRLRKQLSKKRTCGKVSIKTYFPKGVIRFLKCTHLEKKKACAFS